MGCRHVDWCRLSLLLCALAAGTVAGCSKGDRPQIGRVRGTVTLDGEPLANAGVLFRQRGFRPSTGFTDENGYYELKYLRDIMGAAVGTHTVSIDRLSSEEGQPAEHLPARYNRNTDLEREVKPGRNTIDFALTSD